MINVLNPGVSTLQSQLKVLSGMLLIVQFFVILQYKMKVKIPGSSQEKVTLAPRQHHHHPLLYCTHLPQGMKNIRTKMVPLLLYLSREKLNMGFNCCQASQRIPKCSLVIQEPQLYSLLLKEHNPSTVLLLQIIH